MVISNRDNITLLDLDAMLTPESSQRMSFLNGVVEAATGFLEKHHSKFEELEVEAAALEECARQKLFIS